MGTEAAFHPIEEYMIHVEEQFQLLARRVHVDKKRVYLATDDPSLLQEAKNKLVTVSVGLTPNILLNDTSAFFLSLPGIQNMSSSATTPSRGRLVCTTATPRTLCEGSSWTSTSCPRPTSWSAPSPRRSASFWCLHRGITSGLNGHRHDRRHCSAITPTFQHAQTDFTPSQRRFVVL